MTPFRKLGNRATLKFAVEPTDPVHPNNKLLSSALLYSIPEVYYEDGAH